MTSNPKNYFFQKVYEKYYDSAPYIHPGESILEYSQKYYDSAPYIHDGESISDWRARLRRFQLIGMAQNGKTSQLKVEPFVPFEGVLPIIVDDILDNQDYDYKTASSKTRPENNRTGEISLRADIQQALQQQIQKTP